MLYYHLPIKVTNREIAKYLKRTWLFWRDAYFIAGDKLTQTNLFVPTSATKLYKVCGDDMDPFGVLPHTARLSICQTVFAKWRKQQFFELEKPSVMRVHKSLLWIPARVKNEKIRNVTVRLDTSSQLVLPITGGNRPSQVFFDQRDTYKLIAAEWSVSPLQFTLIYVLPDGLSLPEMADLRLVPSYVRSTLKVRNSRVLAEDTVMV